MVDIDPQSGIAGAGMGFSLGGAPSSAYDIYSQKAQEEAIKPLDPYAETNPFGTTDYKPEETAEGILGGTAETAAYVQAVQDLNRFVEENIARGVDPTRPDVRNKDTVIANSIYRSRLSRVRELAYRLQTQQTLETQRLKGVMEGTIIPSSRERAQSDYFRAPEAPDMRVYEEALPGQLDPQVNVFNRAHAQMTYETPEAYKTMQMEEERLKTYLAQKYQKLLESGRPKEEVEMWYQNQLNGIQGAAYEPKQASHIYHHSRGGGKGSGSGEDEYIFDNIYDDMTATGTSYRNISTTSTESKPEIWNKEISKSTRLSSVSVSDKEKYGFKLKRGGNVYTVAEWAGPMGITRSIDPTRAKFVDADGNKTAFRVITGVDAPDEVPADEIVSKSGQGKEWEAGLEEVQAEKQAEGVSKSDAYNATLTRVFPWMDKSGKQWVRLVYNYRGQITIEDYDLGSKGTRERLNQIFSSTQKFGAADNPPNENNQNVEQNSGGSNNDILGLGIQ